MAIDGNRNYYKYGTGWWYGEPIDDSISFVVKSIGFQRPECKKR
jgi:hypothetical protein